MDCSPVWVLCLFEIGQHQLVGPAEMIFNGFHAFPSELLKESNVLFLNMGGKVVAALFLDGFHSLPYQEFAGA